jgi:plasmid stabilization system protein ParE
VRGVLSSQAVADLRHFARFIAQDNPTRAVAFVADLRNVAGRSDELPHGCRWCRAMSGTASDQDLRTAIDREVGGFFHAASRGPVAGCRLVEVSTHLHR